MKKNLFLILVVFLLSGCAASTHPDYKPMYQRVEVQQEKIDLIRKQFDAQGLNDALINRDAIGRLRLEGIYASEKDVARAFDIARSIAGVGAVSPVTPNNIKRKDWEVGLTEGLAQYIDRIAKKYNMAISSAPVQKTDSAPQKSLENAGLDTQVFDADLNGVSQFEAGVSQPSPKARQFYAEIAKKMAEDAAAASSKGNKKFLLIGHTDDMGDTNFNAKLSEDRARAIAQIFGDAGISNASIFYQGAGETLPIADNATAAGRSNNRRVELVEMKDEQTLNGFLVNRRPNIAFYRPVNIPTPKPQGHSSEREDYPVKKDEPIRAALKKSPKPPLAVSEDRIAPQSQKEMGARRDDLDFGGKPLNATNAKLKAGEFFVSKSMFSLISDAQASIVKIDACNLDRPRNAGLVKSLKGDVVHKTVDYLPGLYGKTWYGIAGGNLIVLNKVAVLRNGVVPANKPELKVYANYKPSADGKDPDPDVYIDPDVNTYQTTNGIIYRLFANSEKGIECLDILMPLENGTFAKESKIIYRHDGAFVADFNLKKN